MCVDCVTLLQAPPAKDLHVAGARACSQPDYPYTYNSRRVPTELGNVYVLVDVFQSPWHCAIPVRYRNNDAHPTLSAIQTRDRRSTRRRIQHASLPFGFRAVVPEYYIGPFHEKAFLQ